MLNVVVAVMIGLISAALTWRLSRKDSLIRILDLPNERSLHAAPVPRTGGIAICLALLSGWSMTLVASDQQILPVNILLGAVIIAVVALLDDRYGLSPVSRLLVQFVAALILVYGGGSVSGELLPGMSSLGELGAGTVTVLMTVWITNLYNFMDGMDGFAGGMAVIGFGTLAVLGWWQGDLLFAGSALAVCAAAAGFLWFNFPPARIFMGDSGSTTLGFLAAAFAVWGSRRDIAPVWLTLVIFSPFVVDATVTLLRRAVHGEPVWRAHRSHYYQRLVQLGWGHRRTVLAEYVAMLMCAAAALVASGAGQRVQWFILMILAGGYTLAALAIQRLEHKRYANSKH